MTRAEKIEKLMAVLTFAFLLGAQKWGMESVKKNQYPSINIENKTRPQYTYFRYGLDYLRDAVVNTVFRVKEFKKCLKLLDSALKTFAAECAT